MKLKTLARLRHPELILRERAREPLRFEIAFSRPHPHFSRATSNSCNRTFLHLHATTRVQYLLVGTTQILSIFTTINVFKEYR